MATTVDDAVYQMIVRSNSSAIALSAVFADSFETHFDAQSTLHDGLDDLNLESLVDGFWSCGTETSKLQNAETMSCDTTRQHSPEAEDVDQGGAKPSGRNGRKNKKPVYWTEEEHARFVAWMQHFNGNRISGLGFGVAELVSAALKNRSVSQVRSHAQKYFAELKRQETEFC
eukprot:65275-Rhodomonas_salina.1